MPRRSPLAFISLVVVLAACARAAPSHVLAPMDGDRFRRAFDEDKDHPRLLVALSPT